MNSLSEIKQTMSSREIAQITGKQHKHVIRDCEILNENYEKLTEPKIGLSSYKDSTGRNLKCYLLTKIQCFDLMTGYNVELRIKVNRRWEQLEKANGLPDFSNPVIAARAWADEVEKRMNEQARNQEQQKQLEAQKPKVLFADAVNTSNTTILVGELAKILKQNGIDIGQNRLFAWLRAKGYLISRRGTDYNSPTQRAMDLGLFKIKENSILHSDGHVSISKTTKVTGKGQNYFINKFLSNATSRPQLIV